MSAIEPRAAEGFPRRPSPEIVLASACLIGAIAFGPRSALGLFQLPITAELGWGRDVF